MHKYKYKKYKKDNRPWYMKKIDEYFKQHKEEIKKFKQENTKNNNSNTIPKEELKKANDEINYIFNEIIKNTKI